MREAGQRRSTMNNDNVSRHIASLGSWMQPDAEEAEGTRLNADHGFTWPRKRADRSHTLRRFGPVRGLPFVFHLIPRFFLATVANSLHHRSCSPTVMANTYMDCIVLLVSAESWSS